MLVRSFSRVAAASWYSPRQSWNGDGSGEAVCVRVSSNRDTGDITPVTSPRSTKSSAVFSVSPTEPPGPDPGPLPSFEQVPSCPSLLFASSARARSRSSKCFETNLNSCNCQSMLMHALFNSLGMPVGQGA